MSKFNLRVYGLCLNNDGAVLVSEEVIRGEKIIKFPGGGVEFGEGLLDALKREWIEELSTEIKIIKHFYTTDFYQPSIFDASQVISIYYFVEPLKKIAIPYHNSREYFYFLPISALNVVLSLPIDKVVAKMLLHHN